MKKSRKTKLSFAKQVVSKFTTDNVKGGATQSDQQATGCNTNCPNSEKCQIRNE
jgi:hypothetical protein